MDSTSGRTILRHVVGDALKNLVFYGAVGWLAGWLATRIWWLGGAVFVVYAIVVAIDALQHLGLVLTLPALWFGSDEPKADIAAESVATTIRVAESGLLLWLGYLSYLKLSEAA